MTGLKERLRQPGIVVAPGVYDAFSAMVAEQAGFEALYLSGASIAYTRLGRPDIGLVSLSEVAESASLVAERTSAPIIVDGDTGFGNALNVQRTVRLLGRAGAAAVQLEDQATPKRCGHLADKTLIPAAEMVGKIHAALDARPADSMLLIARTDAAAVECLAAALDRADAYAEAGADLIFVEALGSEADMRTVCARFAGRNPVMANMVEGGRTPPMPARALEKLGFDLVIFPGGAVRAVARQLQDYYGSLRAHGSTEPFREKMLDFQDLNDLLGTESLLAAGKRYAGD